MNYWMDRVAESKAKEAEIERALRWEALSEEIQWAGLYGLVAIVGVGACWFRTIAVGGGQAVPMFIGLSLLVIGIVIGCWRMSTAGK